MFDKKYASNFEWHFLWCPVLANEAYSSPSPSLPPLPLASSVNDNGKFFHWDLRGGGD